MCGEGVCQIAISITQKSTAESQSQTMESDACVLCITAERVRIYKRTRVRG